MFRVLVTLFVIFNSAVLLADTWKPVTNAETVKALFNEKKIVATISEGKQSTAYYRSNGTAEVNAWGTSFKRQWKVEDNGDACLLIDDDWNCFRIEQSTENAHLYRATHLETSQQITFSESQDQLSIAESEARKAGGDGGAAQPSADEIAAQLANPNSPLATLRFKFVYTEFKGDLPDADNQSLTTLVFQPTFPFALDNGDLVFFRPAVPIVFDQPSIDPASGDFYDADAGLGDIVFDLAYARTTPQGILYAAGIVATLPTATEDEIGQDRYAMGPEFLIGKITPKWVAGAFPSHQWDVGGPGDATINRTNLQIAYTYLPEGGWNIGSSPILSYDHETDESTIPLNLTVGKTMILSGRPWKFGVELNYYVEQPDPFGPDWSLTFEIAPVVQNVFASLFK